ncbi:hypothetical protein LTR36_006528 [Oleoguttula mirabilis]|uniref:Xylanolytic transcriptional activator regulatory domain-containing protein n=1 Tax=Oleoguttula mirabilis TaxID=1507867 RepID=A0AAV9JWX1_9PEZI|nr:hypothetical protein LTR36_006528 [Oleoguttula mirabilis]
MRAVLKQKQEEGSKTPPREAPSGRPQSLWYGENGPDGSGQQSGLGPAVARQAGARAAVHFKQPDEQPSGSTLWPKRFPDKPAEEWNDVVDRGMLSMGTARQLYSMYRTDLYPHYPMVAIPDSVSADDMRQAKPTLFLAVIAAASSKVDSELSAALDKEVLQAYATRSLVQSEKSLELVQALLISAIWYHPPSRFGQLKYYEYIHMAATMAMDIGIGTRPVRHRHSRLGKHGERGQILLHDNSPSSLIHPAEDATNPDLSMTPRWSTDSGPDTGSTECRRTFLACYIVCAGVSLSLRRPNMLRVSSYIRECVDHLERATDTLPSDRMLLAWVRLIMIGEEISVSFSYEDPGGIAGISELRTQLMLKDFERRLTAWFTSVPDTDVNGSLTIMYYTVRLYLHEIALHVDHSPEDFRAPYQMGVVHSSGDEEIPTKVLADSIAECITCSHSLLTTFFAMEVDSCRALPVFSYVRVSFAAFVLAKLCLSASHPGSRIGRVLDRTSLEVESYMDRAILHVREIVGPLRCRVPAIFLALLFKLRQWCLNPQMIENSQEDGTLLQTIPPSHDRAAKSLIDPPRMVEQSSSSSDSSPQMLAGGHQAAYEGFMRATQEAAYQVVSGFTPGSSSSSHNVYSGPAMGAESVTVAGGVSVPEDSGYEPALDQMQLNEEFLASLGDMTGFPEGGLTGLDDWMPNDFMGMGQLPDMLNWQAAPGGSGYNETVS